MNNNNSRQPNNNNRRRGRNNNNNNNRQQQNNRSGFDYQNNIDNRARGNASQMLEKYKKLASDAQFNDDRVNAEYHLQFADHYFRVLADFRSRQEVRQEQQGERRPREDVREDSRVDRDDWQNEDRSPSYEEQVSNEGSFTETETETADDNANNNDGEDRRPQRENRPRRDNRSDRPERNGNDRNGNRAPRRHHSEETVDEPVGIDLAVLPPSIAIANDFDDAEIEAKPARKPRARRPKSANDEDVVTAAE